MFRKNKLESEARFSQLNLDHLIAHFVWLETSHTCKAIFSCQPKKG